MYAHAREEPFTTTVDALRSLTMVNWCHRTPLAFEVLRRLRDIMLESEVEKQLVKRVEEHGGEALKLVLLNQAGWLDRTVFLPGGKLAIIECKRPKGGRTRTQQEHWIKRLTQLGFDVRLIKNLEELDEFIF